MNEIRELKEQIVNSLHISPAENVPDLLERDFLHNRSRYGIEVLLIQLEKDGHIYYRGDKIFAYKKSSLVHVS